MDFKNSFIKIFKRRNAFLRFKTLQNVLPLFNLLTLFI
jgi:hypothetical protein